MDINSFKQNYKDIPLNKMIEYIDNKILDKIIIKDFTLLKFFDIKELYNNGELKFNYIINNINEQDLKMILNNLNNVLFKEQIISNNKETCNIHKTLLNVINILLTNQGYAEIKKIIDFKDIPHNILSNEKVIELLEKHENVIFNCMSRVEYKWGKRYIKRDKYNDYGYALYLLRYLCKKINFTFKGRTKKNLKGIYERCYSIES